MYACARRAITHESGNKTRGGKYCEFFPRRKRLFNCDLLLAVQETLHLRTYVRI